ncbi:MAG: hypothetical protein ACM3ZB_03435 [bacterium]
MSRRLALLCLGASVLLFAQNRLSVAQLVDFIRSSIELKQSDREVARYVGRITLSERLEPRVVEELQRIGAGPRTVEALNKLAERSRNLQAARAVEVDRAPVVIPPPSAAEQEAVIKAAREYALEYTKQLPDFLCTQVTRRYYDPSGMEFWHLSDTITARLSYTENREEYKIVLINNRPANTDMDAIGGATSTGEFGSMMRELFDPDTQATFKWERWATLRGRRAHVYSYKVAKDRSKWHVNYQRIEDVVPAYHGLVYIDNDTNVIVRLTFEADLPPSFPLQQASTVLDYDYADIAGQPYLLPLKAVVRMREGRLLVRNDVEFRMYRKFSADAVLKFEAETPDPLPEDTTTEAPPR